MNPNIQQLITISGKSTKLVIGLMSGTSLDGLDIALCNISGSGHHTRVELLHFKTIPYPDEVKKEIRSVFAKKIVELETLCLLHSHIALLHARYVTECLARWNTDRSTIDLIASHGQTIYHAPVSLHHREGYGNATLQLCDGDHIAVATGIITVSDFRQKHIAAGGEGAPLAVYGDYLLLSKQGEDRILLNIGGISNFTFLPGSLNTKEIFCTDTGPGNTLMDAIIQTHSPGTYFDRDAGLASLGRINDNLLTALQDHEFFRLPFPKSTGPELFNLIYLEAAMRKSSLQDIPAEDIMATLNAFTAWSITSGIRACMRNRPGIPVYCSGGGLYNPLLIQHIRDQLPGSSLQSTSELGIDPGAKEAICFAVLANECVCGDPAVFNPGLHGMPAVSMGKISFPA